MTDPNVANPDEWDEGPEQPAENPATPSTQDPAQPDQAPPAQEPAAEPKEWDE